MMDKLPFTEFLTHLTRLGFVVGVDHHIRLHTVLNTLGADCPPAQLKSLLCPIFATNAKQQKEFYRAFESYFKAFEPEHAEKVILSPSTPLGIDSVEGLPAEQETAQKPPEPLGARKLPYFLVGTLLVLLIALFASGIIDLSLWLSPAIPTPTPTPTLTATPTSGGEPSTPPANPLDVTIRVEPANPRPFPLNLYQEHWYMFWWLGVLTPLIVFGLHETYRRNRRKLVLQKERGKKPPFIYQIQVEPPEPMFLKHEQFYNAARLMRQRLKSDVSRLDVDATITKTIASGGFPEFQYRAVTRPPEYLALIDLPQYRDHYAHLADSIVAALDNEGLFVTRYFYEGNPRVCFQEVNGKREYLTGLHNKYSDCRLLLFGRGEELLAPLSGELESWTTVFQPWRERALLTTAPPQTWGAQEIALAGEFIVIPATLDGLAALVGHFKNPEKLDLRYWRVNVDRTFRFGQSNEPEGSLYIGQSNEPEGSLYIGQSNEPEGSLYKEYLGEDAFQWLCACAVYPELHWDLTLFLGSLPCMPEHLMSEEHILKLIRLPYFREGVMPDELRWELLGELDLDKSREIRQVIIDLLVQNPPPEESVAYDNYFLNIAVNRWLLSRKDRKRLKEVREAWERRERHSEDSVPYYERPYYERRVQDYTLLKFLEGMPSRLNLVLPKGLRKVFFNKGVPLFGLKRGIRLAVIALLILLAGVFIREPANKNIRLRFLQKSDNTELAQMELVWIQGGCFQMGQTEAGKNQLIQELGEQEYSTSWHQNELPQHEVCVDGFWIGKTEVTNRQYRIWNPAHDSQEYEGNSLNGDEQPAVYVSWEQATQFAEWLTQNTGNSEFRLPTEAEWEYAARAGTTTSRYWGDNPDDACQYANVADKTSEQELSFGSIHNCDDGYAVTAPVGSF